MLVEGSENIVYCCVCRNSLIIGKHYGREGICCCRECNEEYEWRMALQMLGKPYRLPAAPPAGEGV